MGPFLWTFEDLLWEPELKKDLKPGPELELQPCLGSNLCLWLAEPATPGHLPLNPLVKFGIISRSKWVGLAVGIFWHFGL